jgi:uncharacterized membrane protein
MKWNLLLCILTSVASSKYTLTMQDLLIILILNVVGALCYPFDPENMATIRSTFGLPELPYSLGLRLHLALLFAFGSNI